jgi:hypothetical protein
LPLSIHRDLRGETGAGSGQHLQLPQDLQLLVVDCHQQLDLFLASEFANFLGLPQRPRQNVTDIADAVCQVLTDARTDLVIVDEIHNLNLATSVGEDMSDHLKYFTEHMHATFVYAGINVENSGLFTGLRGRQISARSVLTSTGPFPHDQEWASLVATLEGALRLHDHPPGFLASQTQYLHHRTSGSISSLSHLIR